MRRARIEAFPLQEQQLLASCLPRIHGSVHQQAVASRTVSEVSTRLLSL